MHLSHGALRCHVVVVFACPLSGYRVDFVIIAATTILIAILRLAEHQVIAIAHDDEQATIKNITQFNVCHVLEVHDINVTVVSTSADQLQSVHDSLQLVSSVPCAATYVIHTS